MAFQADAFQNDAFQIGGVVAPPAVPSLGGSARTGLRRRARAAPRQRLELDAVPLEREPARFRLVASPSFEAEGSAVWRTRRRKRRAAGRAAVQRLPQPPALPPMASAELVRDAIAAAQRAPRPLRRPPAGAKLQVSGELEAGTEGAVALRAGHGEETTLMILAALPL